MYSPVILEHFRRPRRSGEMDAPDRTGSAHNALCGDHVRYALRISSGRIADVRFRAEACAVCVAAASILAERIIGMETGEAARIPENELIQELQADLRDERRRCATLPLEALRAALTVPSTTTPKETRMADTSKGRFVWYELMTTDPEGAKKFYTNVVGWGAEQYGEPSPDMPPYDMWLTANGPVGGVMELPPDAKAAGAPPHWTAYVSVPDVDESLKQAEAMGAHAIVGPMDVPGIGRFALIADPQGATINLFKSANETPESDGPPIQGEFSWNELATSDYAAATDFYSKLFGWEKDQPMDMGEHGMYQIYKRGNIPLGGIYNKGPEMNFPNSWLYYVHVDDVTKRAELVKQNGGQVTVGPLEVPGGDWIVVGIDPQGATFAMHSRKP